MWISAYDLEKAYHLNVILKLIIDVISIMSWFSSLQKSVRSNLFDIMVNGFAVYISNTISAEVYVVNPADIYLLKEIRKLEEGVKYVQS